MAVVMMPAAAPSSPGALTRREVPAGVVTVEALHNGWYHVAVGRARVTKRFNLSHAEAAELVRVLRAEVLAEGES